MMHMIHIPHPHPHIGVLLDRMITGLCGPDDQPMDNDSHDINPPDIISGV